MWECQLHGVRELGQVYYVLCSNILWKSFKDCCSSFRKRVSPSVILERLREIIIFSKCFDDEKSCLGAKFLWLFYCYGENAAQKILRSPGDDAELSTKNEVLPQQLEDSSTIAKTKQNKTPAMEWLEMCRHLRNSRASGRAGVDARGSHSLDSKA